MRTAPSPSERLGASFTRPPLKRNAGEPLSLSNSAVLDDPGRASPAVRLLDPVLDCCYHLPSQLWPHHENRASPEWKYGIAAAHTDQASREGPHEANAMTGGEPFILVAMDRHRHRLR